MDASIGSKQKLDNMKIEIKYGGVPIFKLNVDENK